MLGHVAAQELESVAGLDSKQPTYPLQPPACAPASAGADPAEPCGFCVVGVQSRCSATISAKSRACILPSWPVRLKPSVIMVRHKGHAVATVSAPVSAACLARITLMRSFSSLTSYHMFTPPAPQHRPSLRF